MRSMHIRAPFLVIALFVPFPAWGDVLRVPGDFPFIQFAINEAKAGDTVLIADGVYSGAFNVYLDFLGKAITVTSENGTEKTVIDCQGGLRGVNFVSGEGHGSVLSGITIRNGNGDGVPSGGGGVICVSSSPTIEDCRFERCYSGFGGALHVEGGSPSVRRCVFLLNCFGAVTCRQVSTATFEACEFLESGRGAIGVQGEGAQPRFKSCRFLGTSGNNQIHCGDKAAPSFDRCSIASGDGTVLDTDNGASPTFTNCLIAGNRGAIAYSIQGSSPRFVHCTMAENKVGLRSTLFAVGSTGFKAQVILENCIVWGNEAEGIIALDNRPQVVARYSLIQGDILWPGPGNRNTDPRFVSAGSFEFGRVRAVDLRCGTISVPDFVLQAGDYHLQAGSPAIDAAPQDTPLLEDLEGRGRPCGAGFDLGAYEAGDCPPPTLTSPAAVVVGTRRRELVSVELRDGQGQGIPGAPVDFLAEGVGISFPFSRAYTNGEGMAFTVLDSPLPGPDLEDLQAAFTVNAMGLKAGPIPVSGSNLVADGPLNFQAPPLAVFDSPTQRLTGEACGFVFPEDVGRPVGAWSIDPTVAEIGDGSVTAFLEDSHCDRMEFEVTSHRPGSTAFIIGTVDLTVYLADVVLDLPFRRSDSNGDAELDLSDPINTLGFLFTGDGEVGCADAADSNDDGSVDLADAIHSLAFLFTDGSAPPAPGHLACGPDPSGDGIVCGSPQGCE